MVANSTNLAKLMLLMLLNDNKHCNKINLNWNWKTGTQTGLHFCLSLSLSFNNPHTLVITTVSRRLETLRLMKGKQAHSDDCPATANCSDNSGDIRYDTRNSYDYNDFTDIENGDNNNNSKSRNNNFGQHLR